MAHKLDKFYNAFGGLDTRSNRLTMKPNTFTKFLNARYNFQDELEKANGFQHKDVGAPAFVGQFEYKYRDVNTGESKTQILAVGTDGNLYKQRKHILTFISTGSFTGYSVYYRADAFQFYALYHAPLGDSSVNIGTGSTLDDLKISMNTVGMTVDVVDEDGNSVTSTLPAYLLDIKVNDTTFADNSATFWEVVTFPDSSSVPFPVTLAAQSDDDIASRYEGISHVNLNNAIYITDGGFPMKYDGAAVYRSGVPACIRFVRANFGMGISPVAPGLTTTANTALSSGNYLYKFRYGFKDYNGAVFYGKETEPNLAVGPDCATISNPTSEAAAIQTGGYDYGKDFPVFGCKVSSYNSGTKTITTDGAHNVKAGMCIVQPVWDSAYTDKTTENFQYHYYAKVLSVTSNTIVLDSVDTTEGTYNNFVATQILNAAYVPTHLHGKTESVLLDGKPPYGSFIEIYRTKKDQHTTGPFYLAGLAPIPILSDYVAPFDLFVVDNKPDASLVLNFEDADPGQEIPRACKYLSSWQGQLVQAGRPPDISVIGDYYPSAANTSPTLPAIFDSVSYIFKISEANLCDFQSIYWADSLSPEGFPQDGLHEFAIDTPFADEIKGIAKNKDAFFAFKERSTGVLTGSLAENDISLEILEDDIGCANHLSIQEVMGSLIWLDPSNGFYSCVAGRLPVPIGFPIMDQQKVNSSNLDYSSAVSANFRAESLYICGVGSTMFVFDYAQDGELKRNCWYIWDRLTVQSILATSEDELLVYDGTRTWKMKRTNTDYDHTDHQSAISMDVRTAWLTQGAPTVDKNYQAVWINSIQGDFSLDVQFYGNFLDAEISSKTLSMKAEDASKKFIKQEVKCPISKLSAISIGFKNAEKNKKVKIQGWELQYSTDFDGGEPRR